MSKKLLANIIFLILMRALLDLSYIYFIAPLFGYEGFKLVPDVGQYIVSWVLYLVMIPLAPHSLRNVSDAVFALVVASVVAPLTSMYGLSGESVAPVIMTVSSLALVCLIVNAKAFKVIRLPVINNSDLIATLISLFAIGIVVVHYLLSGVHLSTNLLKVYDFRRANEGLAANGIFAYLNPWAYQTFNLFLIATCLMRKRHVLAIFLFIIQVFLFMASQQKSVLFAPWLIFGVWWYLRKSNSLLVIPASLCALVVVSLLFFWINGNILIPSIAIRRLFFIPAHLDFAYYSFFSNHQKVVWADSFWMPLIHSPYAKSIPYVIGGYLGAPDMHANNGYVASGFAQAGVLGVAIYTVVLGYILKFVDNESRRLGSIWFGVSLFILPFMTIWLSTDLVTAMLTHGFIVMIFLISFLRCSGSLAAQNSINT